MVSYMVATIFVEMYFQSSLRFVSARLCRTALLLDAAATSAAHVAPAPQGNAATQMYHSGAATNSPSSS
jgi:hypothetical protein